MTEKVKIIENGFIYCLKKFQKFLQSGKSQLLEVSKIAFQTIPHNQENANSGGQEKIIPCSHKKLHSYFIQSNGLLDFKRKCIQ